MLLSVVSTVTTELNDKNAEKVSHDAHPEFLNNICTIKLLLRKKVVTEMKNK